MSGNKAMRRAAMTKDAIRISGDVPLITDTTELITPELAQEMLKRNKANRPINWRKVKEYADLMAAGKWQLTAQGIVLDGDGNILTGQKRLWGVIYSGASVYMRVSRGNPSDTASLLDRGTPQSARDLASRRTEKKHSPTEASIARAVCALRGNLKPRTDDLAEVITSNSDMAAELLYETAGTRKTKPVIMILAAICEARPNGQLRKLCNRVESMSQMLEKALAPETAERCWGKGAAFAIAMENARKIVSG